MSDVPPRFPHRERPRAQGPDTRKSEGVSPQASRTPQMASPAASQDTRTDEQKRLDARRDALVAKTHQDAKIVEEIERLETLRNEYLKIISDAGIKIGAPMWGAIKEKISPWGVGRSIREGKIIKNNAVKEGIGKKERISLITYRNWLINRAGEKIGGNIPGARLAGIEKRLADVLKHSYAFGAERAIDPKIEAERERVRRRALKILRGLKIEEPHVVDRIKRNVFHPQRAKAWIYKPPLVLHGGYFFIRPDAESKDIHRAIEAASEKKKHQKQKGKSKKKKKASKKK